ncbi:MAG: type II toxin-antitoxin system VapC family toxin [Bifidobacteriaceae bacterium]|nr:type II toxin-antitoxin system VapC family toxin [Bifidobacteriaceae bacterium]
MTPDTSVLVRLLVEDDPVQSPAARRALGQAALIAITVLALCEVAWVLRSAYGVPPPEIAQALRTLLAAGDVRADRAIVDAGLAVLDAGGDFSDGAIAAAGLALGGEQFVTFDRRAADLVERIGLRVSLL